MTDADIRKAIQELYQERKSKQDRLDSLSLAVYGPINEPKKGLLYMTQQNSIFINQFKNNINKLTWFGIFAGLSAMGTFFIMVGRMLIKQGGIL